MHEPWTQQFDCDEPSYFHLHRLISFSYVFSSLLLHCIVLSCTINCNCNLHQNIVYQIPSTSDTSTEKIICTINNQWQLHPPALAPSTSLDDVYVISKFFCVHGDWGMGMIMIWYDVCYMYSLLNNRQLTTRITCIQSSTLCTIYTYQHSALKAIYYLLSLAFVQFAICNEISVKFHEISVKVTPGISNVEISEPYYAISTLYLK
jgi:hypothetical protein